ncbi:hypothetical protein JG687_00010272 [Phytophthora cactorum]|uniref:Uncharacterized protein n=1 Tax=Phytophthora cactorum TaxID=29920 RepID=A0A8T1UAG1_9STRA|nr:hypothetical protein JG687_00010272 [Phytophthora cactorum]
MRSRGCYFRYFGRDTGLLDALGVNLKLSARAWQEYIVPLLDIYATQHGAGEDIPDDFIIPSEAPWPEKVWEGRLGPIVARNASQIAVVAQTES